MAREREDKKSQNPRSRVVRLRKEAEKFRKEAANSSFMGRKIGKTLNALTTEADARVLEDEIDEAIGTADKKRSRKIKKNKKKNRISRKIKKKKK